MKIMSEYDHNEAERQITRILMSPEGRDLGRWLLVEPGKGEEGNIPQIINELLDIFASKMKDLYSSPAPVQSR